MISWTLIYNHHKKYAANCYKESFYPLPANPQNGTGNLCNQSTNDLLWSCSLLQPISWNVSCLHANIISCGRQTKTSSVCSIYEYSIISLFLYVPTDCLYEHRSYPCVTAPHPSPAAKYHSLQSYRAGFLLMQHFFAKHLVKKCMIKISVKSTHCPIRIVSTPQVRSTPFAIGQTT